MDASQFRVKLPASAKLKNARASDKRYCTCACTLHLGMVSSPVYAPREAVGGARRGRRCTPASPASCAGHARRQACEWLSAGWRVPAERTMLRLNSHFLGF